MTSIGGWKFCSNFLINSFSLLLSLDGRHMMLLESWDHIETYIKIIKPCLPIQKNIFQYAFCNPALQILWILVAVSLKWILRE